MSVRENLDAITCACAQSQGFDVLILSVANSAQAAFWRARLAETLSAIGHAWATLYVVHEDWPGGAGNGLGTLYAWQKANEQALASGHPSLMERLCRGESVALYHTAGKGTRLAPLPGSEENNKPAVKLPVPIPSGSGVFAYTLLEAVIKQTVLFAPVRKGRLSVFWGDQIFIPSRGLQNLSSYAVDIIGQVLSPPIDRALWEARNLSAYGLLAIDSASQSAQQLEKIDFATMRSLVEKDAIHISGGMAVSLGSFGLSAEFLALLLEEFQTELQRQSTKMDADPHFWMPLTLDLQTYQEIMAKKGLPFSAAEAHWQRIQRLIPRLSSRARVGVQDVGQETLWWDFGTVSKYFENCLKLVGEGSESEAMRQFFEVGQAYDPATQTLMIESSAPIERVRRSVLFRTQTDGYSTVEDSVVIGSRLTASRLSRNLVYQAEINGALDAEEVVSGARDAEGKAIQLYTTLRNNGQLDWFRRLPKNTVSYDELYQINDRRAFSGLGVS
ncbi:MAG: hypothetical protein NZM04_05150 [Methylacidiphilales bacterium]|nr:hypothetical protein [Candidatus Methylacidiphilales bacterium]MDW8349489.1 hypothetical protein [Verrucomicrobiae bacterium]